MTVYTRSSGCLCGISFTPEGTLTLTHVGTGLRRIADDDGQPGRRRERRERLPVDVFGQDSPENGLAGLVGSAH